MLALAGLLPANAQYTFTLNASWSGNCSGYTAQMNSMMGKYKSQAINGFPTRELCEQTRAMCHQELGHIELVYYDVKTGKVIKRETTNCKLNVTTTPCTGRPMAGTVGTLNVLGVSQGTSFYSTNSANEIQNWSSDDMERMLALNKSFNSFEPTNVSTGDPYFDDARNRAGSSLPYIGDGAYRGIPETPLIEANTFGQANIDNVNRYLENSQGLGIAYIANPQDLSLILQKQYQSLTGYDINAIMNKLDKTDADKQAIADYNEYAKRMCDQMASEIEQQMGRMDRSEEKKQIDMAIIAKDCYGSGSPEYLGMTDYKRITAKDIDNPYYRSIAEELEKCNATNPETGFHGVLYYNEKTGSIVIGCEGSSESPLPSVKLKPNMEPEVWQDAGTGDYVFSISIPSTGQKLEFRYAQDQINDWGLNNAKQAIGVTASQFELAHNIANVINNIPEDIRKDLDINIVGHSLGGGLASVIGLATGKPTYTYNAEGVSDNILKSWGLLEKKQNSNYDITAYHSSTDVLTYAQKHPAEVASAITGNTAALGVVVAGLTAGATLNKDGTFEKSKSDKSSNKYFAEAVGTKKNIGAHGFHDMESVTKHFIKENTATQSEWERIRYSRNSILAAKQNGSLQKVDHINVLFE